MVDISAERSSFPLAEHPRLRPIDFFPIQDRGRWLFMLRDPADQVRAAAVQSLGRLRAAAAVTPLGEVLERGAEALRGRAAFALGQLAGGASSPDAARRPGALSRRAMTTSAAADPDAGPGAGTGAGRWWPASPAAAPRVFPAPGSPVR